MSLDLFLNGCVKVSPFPLNFEEFLKTTRISTRNSHLRDCHLQGFSKCGPCTRSISITHWLIKNAKCWVLWWFTGSISWQNIFVWVSVRVFLGEISIWIRRLRVNPPSPMWANILQSVGGPHGTEGGRRLNSLSLSWDHHLLLPLDLTAPDS